MSLVEELLFQCLIIISIMILSGIVLYQKIAKFKVIVKRKNKFEIDEFMENNFNICVAMSLIFIGSFALLIFMTICCFLFL